ncbi:MAG: trigger factor [Minisyncoccia bacterium]
MKTEIKKLENSQVEISVTLPAADVEKHREKVEKEALANVQVDGFRKGNVPKDIAMKQIQPMRVLEEMAQQAISDAYVSVLQETKVKAIGHPQIMITKIAEGSDLEFTLTTAVLPEITLGDYKKIAQAEMKKKEEVVIEDKELQDAIDNVRKMRAQQQMTENAAEGEVAKSWNDIKDEDLPELTDEFVKEIGKFENVEDFKTKIKENLVAEKESKNIEKKRIAIIEGILEKSTIEVPQMMVDYEVTKMMHEFEGNISMTGMNFDEYLKSIGKTRDDYKTEWQDQGKKRAQTQLMLNEIAAQEKIEASDADIDAEVTKIMEQYKDQKNIDENNVKAYVSSVLTHQKVFEFLEKK